MFYLYDVFVLFSYSFEKAEDNSLEIWRFNLYNLYQEYYSLVWIAPPFNLLWYVIVLAKYLVNKCRHCGGEDRDKADENDDINVDEDDDDLFGMADDLFCKNTFVCLK